ncbi:Uncharacterised protein [Zhongshania aliphaticivorans]|uniref:TonB C-terminal domain-containing protein n=1 Tax=Zhongshania aliphaticivorans TaxID=1470434 RepID=A0A5S9Q4J9_9GAMM|nr:TonB family protein [Zhongshania aliphaticivorans]CAA0094759.1 Uncharacterised protein [Zhongshania aliphaticivorans]CAA0112669.1 Uncharacterised protein [Zhongshania aliphaticivorans]
MSNTIEHNMLGFDSWGIHLDADRRFRKILINVLGVTCVLLIAMSYWVMAPSDDLLEEKKEDYFLEIIKPAPIEKPKLELPKVVEKKVVEKKVIPPKPVEVVKKAVPAPKPKANQVAERKAVDKVAAAKKVAAASGVMAFSEQLAVMRETNSSAVASANTLRDRGSVLEEMNAPSDNILSTSSNGIKSGVSNGENISDQGQKLVIGKHTTQKVSSFDGGQQVAAATRGGSAASGPQGRSLEEIQLAFDKSKSAFYAIFNRAARKDASIGTGTVVVSLTIQPDGTVSDCKIVSSSFFNPDLKEKLIQRVKRIRFESKSVPVFVYDSYPISYVPS